MMGASALEDGGDFKEIPLIFGKSCTGGQIDIERTSCECMRRDRVRIHREAADSESEDAAT